MLTLLFALSALAAQDPKPITFSCMTEYPTTTFLVDTQGKEVVARVIHHNGTGYAPSIVGVFTPNDIPLLTERSNLVRKMKSDMTFRWPKEKCQWLGEMVFQCFGSGDVQEGEGGAKIAPFGLYSGTSVETGIAGEQKSTSVTLTFDVDGATGASIEMKYPEGSCFAGKRELPVR